ncbi:RPM1-interacting protein 4-like [Phragmites australis]|uniref:RPM1-interacting protein 4-like n=1 Tax=Phragmites australis TaxID=29695 RepID=UPI002D78B507|nr:RPM1-interacting protein 4-like [Phragmites australis]
MAKRPTVPKFGTWDSDNVGYTIYFDKVRENKSATAPPLQRPYNPNDPEENPMMSVPPSLSRPATSGGHREPPPRPPNGQSHRRVGSNSSAASDPGGMGAEQSKFAPPPQYHQRPGPQPPQHHGGHHHHPPPAGHGSGGHRAQQALRQQQHHHHAAPAPRARSASPQNNAPNRQRPSAVPKFGVWDEQSAASAAQGFTVQFENVKRHRDVARAAVPEVPRAPSPPEGAAARRSHRDTPFLSKLFGCFHPTVRD